MKKHEKQALARAFAAPPPQRRRVFLRAVPAPRPSGLAFMAMQAHYIRKRVWVLSFAVFAAALRFSATVPQQNLVSLCAAFVPFIALAAVTEATRSRPCGMAELEAAARFSLRSVLLARMGILGVAHLLTLAALAPAACRYGAHPLVQAGACLLAPYLLTDSLCLAAVRRLHGRESLYACVAIAAGVSVGCSWLASLPRLMAQVPLAGWALLLVCLLAQAVRQNYKLIHETEEAAWNL